MFRDVSSSVRVRAHLLTARGRDVTWTRFAWFGRTFWFLNCEVIFTNGSKHKYLHLFYLFTIDILFCPREIWLYWWIGIQVKTSAWNLQFLLKSRGFCSKVDEFVMKNVRFVAAEQGDFKIDQISRILGISRKFVVKNVPIVAAEQGDFDWARVGT